MRYKHEELVLIAYKLDNIILLKKKTKHRKLLICVFNPHTPRFSSTLLHEILALYKYTYSTWNDPCLVNIL